MRHWSPARWFDILGMTEHRPVSEAEPQDLVSRLLAQVQLWNNVRKASSYEDSVFIWIPKNAGTSVHTMLEAAGLVKLNTLPAIRRFFRNKGRVTFGHMSIGSLSEAGLVSREFVERSFKFAISRNPYSRAASLYRVHSRLMRNCHRTPTFVEFLKWIAAGHYDRIGSYNRHGWSQCNPQVEWLRDAWPEKIYRFENLEEFVDDISERWGVSRPELVHVNRSAEGGGLEFSREEKALIEDIYAEDFETFGYARQ
jgi:hypothetical protein